MKSEPVQSETQISKMRRTMKTLEIRRIATGNQGTFGVIKYTNIPFAITLEREWLDNKSGVSCIPAGVYSVLRCNASPEYDYKNSPRFGDTFNVIDVEGRSKILFHKGNIDDDSHGCILVGEQYGDLASSSGILASKAGYTEFMKLLENENEFRLIIVDDWTTPLTEDF